MNKIKNNIIVKKLGAQRTIVTLVIITLVIVFSLASPAFRRYSTFVSIADYTYNIALMAIGVTFVLISGGVDLSIGTGIICYAIAGGYLVKYQNMPVIVGMLVTLLFGLAIGLLNGILVAVMKIPPFLATLCTMMITRGLGTISASGFGIPWPPASAEGGWFRSIFKLEIGGKKYPVGIILIVISAIIMTIVLNKTKVGRYIIAIGSNKEATRLSGVDVTKYHIIAYVICGFFAGLAGIAYAATFASINPGTGAGLELDAIGGAIIGGISTTGGQGTILGALLGVLVMSVLKSGLPYVGFQPNWQQIITGIILIGAVLIDIINNKKKPINK